MSVGASGEDDIVSCEPRGKGGKGGKGGKMGPPPRGKGKGKGVASAAGVKRDARIMAM